MNTLSRRNLVRIVSGAGATGIVATSVSNGSGTLSTVSAASRKIRIRLDREIYAPGERMTLRVTERLKKGRRLRVTDSTGRPWKRVSKAGRKTVWTSRATTLGKGTVVVRATRPDGTLLRDRSVRDRARYRVLRAGSHAGPALIGMSAPADVWAQRAKQVGPGVAARRIFADLADGANSQIRLVEEAHAAGLLPVISYKVGGDVDGAVSGRFNAVAKAAAAKLASYDRPTAVTFWHEPYGDLTPAQYAAASKQILPAFRRGQLRVGPLLNGWLLDNQRAAFSSFCPDELFAIWDWFGIDTYESGTMDSPGSRKPAERIPAVAKFLKSRGYDLPLGIGEYNGYSAKSIADAGEALLSTPNVWFGCLWNSTGGKGYQLTGDRLAAFKSTLADPRSANPR